ncbi:hypothetical protein BKM31_42405 [[Actinomadura] parvosata subsp. kistnae]|uniref:Uncharacterized protein n=1 Tax=[Actinomadura] parvosata subsp. kistnae TaxID=1909395 RepID=A0A1V0AAK8_9ACTN|nr:hypothetical protein BKM31_42405 [Nonomuraea sp. ATCC 55076]
MDPGAFHQVEAHDPEYVRDDAALQRRKAPGEARAFRVVPFVISCGEYVRDPLVDALFLAVDAFGIDPEQDIHPVSGTGGHLWGRDAAVEPE